MSEAVFEERFVKLVEDNGGFEYYQAYRGDVDLILGGKGNTFWYVVMKKGKVTESYIGKNAGGVWEDVYGFGDKGLDVSVEYGVTIAYNDVKDADAGFHLRYLYTGSDVETP